MHRSSFVAAATSLAFAVLTGVGCASTDSGGAVLDDEASDAATSATDGGGSYASCTPNGGSLPPGQDPSKLPTCCTMGAAHCVPTADVPASFASQLATCTGGACVPDSFIENPSLVPTICKSLNAAPGVCLSLCVPQVGTYASLLPQDVCATDERCAPCISPLNMMSTGACDIGKSGGTTCAPAGGGATPSPTADAAPVAAQCPHEGAPVLDPSSLPTCDPNGGAHCLGASLVPTALQSQLATCPTGLCVPDVFIEAGGNFIPATCESLDGAEGRCLDETLPQVAAELSQVPQSTCQSYERCVPCYSPLDGSKTGACTLSCDPGPTKPPVLFATCCSKDGAPQGRCIPTAQVPSAEQADLDTDECTKGEALCVPSEMLPTTFTPPSCTGSSILTGSYTGVCLSTCLDFGFFDSLAIAQGSCDDLHECAPCTDPLTGQPTGAPGCPSP